MRAMLTPFRIRLLVAVGILVVLVFAVGGWYVATQVLAPPAQPLAFSHRVMAGTTWQINCVYCHHDAPKSPAAGMPSVERCMGCHKLIKTESPDIRKLAAYWQNQQPVPWVRIYQLPRFVYFSHEVHVTGAKLDCKECHGDVAKMDVVYKAAPLTMGWCLDCHSKQPNATQLRDCVVCHR